ncbi:MAG: SulP family inorganic anion transporter [Gammaproteobacteria bacterium]|nr:SulP family inorganic anion transporter [Gammaproteobacteria bacterium]
MSASGPGGVLSALGRFAPGIPELVRYRLADVSHDLVAGLSVAAVAVPVGVAYATLAGFDPVVGLYSSVLPLVAYAIFGTSRQLIVGPDAATCALIAAALVPLAGGDPALYASLSAALALLAGLFCIAASFLRLGALADFLSKPILVGFLNGIAISIALGQAGKIFGFPVEAGGILPRVIEIAGNLGQTHGPTFAVGAAAFAVLLVTPRVLPRLPAALVTMVLAAVVVAFTGLGVATIGTVPAGLPALSLPSVPLDLIEDVVAAAAGIALVSFSSAMLTARSFAEKNRYDIDVDREFAALGAANIASAVSQGFAISGAASRTAMSDASGGRTRVAGLFAAAAVALVLVLLADGLQYVPVAALGAVLVMAAVSLLDLASLRRLWVLDKQEFALCVVATLGVVWVGAIKAILFAVTLALLRFVRLVARPVVEILGQVAGTAGFHAVDRHPGAKTTPGLVLFRFNSSLVFFNAPYFRRRALGAIREAGPELRWFVVDAIPITTFDITGVYAMEALAAELRRRGAQLVLAGRVGELQGWLRARGLPEEGSGALRFPTMGEAVRAYAAKFAPPTPALDPGSPPQWS